MIRDCLVFNDDRIEGCILMLLVNEEDCFIDMFEFVCCWCEVIFEIIGMKLFIVVDDVNGDGDDGEFGYLFFGFDIDILNVVGFKFIEML